MKYHLRKTALRISQKPGVPQLILFAGLAFALAVAIGTEIVQRNYHLQQNKIQFEKFVSDLELSLGQFLHPLQGAAGLFQVTNYQLSPQDYLKYARSRRSYDNFPGALGFGFIRRVPDTELAGYLRKMNLSRPGFKVHSVGDLNISNIDPHFIIEMIEPLEKNHDALGLDVASEENRRNAAVLAMKTGQPQLTKKIQLVQIERKEPGFLYYLPIYNTVITPATESERIRALVGWSYAPILASNLISFAVERAKDDLQLRVFEESTDNSSNLLYQTPINENRKSFEAQWSQPISIGGQNWIVQGDRATSTWPLVDHINSIIIFLIISIFPIMLSFYLAQLGRELSYKTKAIVTARRETKDSFNLLAEQQRFLQSTIDNLPAMVGYWDRHLRNISANKVYTEYYGKSPEEIRGLHIRDLLGDSTYAKNLPFIEGVIQGKRQDFERQIRTVSGETKYTLASYIPDIRNEQVIGFFVLVLDISMIKKMEQERQVIQGQLIASSKMSSLGEMASGIAHEINNPLSIISGRSYQLLKSLKKSSLPSDQIASFESDILKIEKTVERIAKIVQGLKTFSRDSTSDPAQNIKFNQIIEDTLSLCSERFKNHNIRLDVTCPDDLYVECFPTEISQIILNLLSNAHDAVENLPQKWVSLEVLTSENEVSVSVKDSGHSIPAEVVEKMMHPFFTTKEVGKGIGLGLSISKGLAEKHHGSLRYDPSSPNTHFILTIPIKQS